MMWEPWKCPECGEESFPKVERFKEGADADGNRWVMLECIECPHCEYTSCREVGWG